MNNIIPLPESPKGVHGDASGPIGYQWFSFYHCLCIAYSSGFEKNAPQWKIKVFFIHSLYLAHLNM